MQMGKGLRSTEVWSEAPLTAHPLHRFLGIRRLPEDVTLSELSYALRLYDLPEVERDALLQLEPGEFLSWQERGEVPQPERSRLAALVGVLAYFSDRADPREALRGIRHYCSTDAETAYLFAKLVNDA